MNLVELLVQELPKRGGWPEHATQARQDEDGEVCFEPVTSADDFHPGVMSSDSAEWLEENNRGTSDLYVTREEYEELLTKGEKNTMKLIDILVKELPGRGGWPQGVVVITQDYDGSTCLWKLPEVSATDGYWRHPTGQALKEYWPADRTVSLAMDRNTAIVSKEEYEDALSKPTKSKVKLIDLLVEKLPQHGGWPASADYAGYRKSAKAIKFVEGGKPGFTEDGDLSIFANADCGTRWVIGEHVSAQAPEDYATVFVSREEYLAALWAEWDGTGLPPVGAEIEVLSPTFGWKAAKVTAVTDNWLVAQYEDGAEFVGAHRILEPNGTFTNRTDMFRALKTEAEVKRELTIAGLQGSLVGSGYSLPEGAAGIIVDAIAQDKVSGIKLAD